MSTAMDKKKAREADRAMRKAQEEAERAEKEAKKQAGMHDHYSAKVDASKAASTKVLKLKEWMAHIPFDSTDESLKFKTYQEVVKAMAAVESKDYPSVATELGVDDGASLLKYISKAMEKSFTGKCKWTSDSVAAKDILKM
jgi:hypothetical protein